jgi:hypothetical protein
MQPHEHEAEIARSECVEGLPRSEDGRAAAPEPARPEHREHGPPDGRDPGRADALRAAVLLFARSTLAPLSVEDAAAIGELHDEDALTELVDSLALTESVEDARAVFDAAIAGIRK